MVYVLGRVVWFTKSGLRRVMWCMSGVGVCELDENVETIERLDEVRIRRRTEERMAEIN